MKDFKKLRENALKKTKEKLQKKLISRDNIIVQSVKVVDLIDKTTNLMTEQLKEWYAIYFPELARIVTDNDIYSILVSNLKTRQEFTESKIENILGKKDMVPRIANAARESMGANIKEPDAYEISKYAADINELRKRRKEIEDYIANVMKDEAPNTSAIIGPVIGARLIASAGSLERLSSMPSSTIQVLGAEKALFSHLKRGTPSPKYGIIFQYPKLRGAPMNLRGKIARKLASKLSIASKLDFFKGEYMGDKMKRELENIIQNMMEKKA